MQGTKIKIKTYPSREINSKSKSVTRKKKSKLYNFLKAKSGCPPTKGEINLNLQRPSN